MAKKAHFIGICGAGMSAVARLMHQAGWDVTGSDEGFYPPVSDYIDRIGLKCAKGHRAENIPNDVATVVIGRHAKLTAETNIEVAHAEAAFGPLIRSFPSVLSMLTEDRTRMVVAGSYGKSSMTAIITWCLLQAGKDPGWFIGAIPKGFDHSSELGGDGPFIFEGDEYPSANFDDRPKFAHYAPHTVLLTSATHDHVNVYPTLADYHAPFQMLLSNLEERKGTLIACTDELNAQRFFYGYHGPKISYGLGSGSNYSATNIELGDPIAGTPTRFSLVDGIEIHPDFTTMSLGRHAVENIVGAAAYLVGQGLLSADEFREGIASFSGLSRRLDRKAPSSALPIFEGFGSSLEKARAAIDAIKAHFPGRRLIVAFEPHTFTWRNRAALHQYKDAFVGCDTVWIFKPPTHGEASHDQSSLSEILAEAQAHHGDVRTFQDGEMPHIFDGTNPSSDVLLILSSGSFGGQLSSFFDAAETQFPAQNT